MRSDSAGLAILGCSGKPGGATITTHRTCHPHKRFGIDESTYFAFGGSSVTGLEKGNNHSILCMMLVAYFPPGGLAVSS